MPDDWQRLYLANDGVIPPLLFKFSPTSTGYGFLMTDLNYIWSEHLDRRSLLKRALINDTTIDPSEDAVQLKVLLQKIGEGLQNEPGSKTSLKPNASADTHALELTVTYELPAPLQPLIWRMSLLKEPQSATTDQLLLPFIKAEADRQARQRSLIEELNKKDWVLAKLFDKIETLGVDLSSIFPGVSGLRGGRNGPTLAQSSKYIKGLAPFNEQSWRDEASNSSSGAELSASVISQMSDSIASMRAPPDGWWKSISETDAKRSSASQDGNKTKTSSKPKTDAMDVDTDAGSETGDDEFQRQETPPRFKKSKNTVQRSEFSQETKGQETESDTRSPKKRKTEDRPAPAMRPKATPPSKPKGLGTIGGKKQTRQKSPTPKSPTPSPSPPAKKPATSKPEEDETTDEDEDLEPPPRHEAKEKEKTAPQPASKPSRELGVIGGRKKQPEPAPKSPEQESEPEPETRASQPPSQSTTEPQQSPPPQQAPKKKTIGRIGAIGGKAKATPSTSEAPTSSKTGDTEETDDDSPPVSRPKARPQEETASIDDSTKQEEEEAPAHKSIKKEATPAEPERELTEEEKANRKREELKRQLAAKSKAPAKKKRRF
ncbi:XRCC4-like factor-domain-containing protein [Aspergillus venezuelensis]